MAAEILDGRAVARTMRQEIVNEVAVWIRVQNCPPTLAIVQLGSDPASERYVQAIERGFTGVGMVARRVTLAEDSIAERLVETLQALNADPLVHGVIVQLPLPAHLKPSVLHTLSPAKDVDGIHPLNAGLLLQGSAEALAPATPLGGIELL
jgi:methylenetetrahydrofolate dehydrogenase (NADP+) / methenyltetrahydrofolate cyclohydrolase